MMLDPSLSAHVRVLREHLMDDLVKWIIYYNVEILLVILNYQVSFTRIHVASNLLYKW